MERSDLTTMDESSQDPSSRTISWIVHPLMTEPTLKSVFLVVIIVFVSGAIVVSFEGIGYGLISVALLLIALSKYLFPTKYILDSRGINSSHIFFTNQYTWDQFQRVDVHSDGVFLSPFGKPHRLDSFRGQFLRFSCNREEVMNAVRSFLPPHAS